MIALCSAICQTVNSETIKEIRHYFEQAHISFAEHYHQPWRALRTSFLHYQMLIDFKQPREAGSLLMQVLNKHSVAGTVVLQNDLLAALFFEHAARCFKMATVTLSVSRKSAFFALLAGHHYTACGMVTIWGGDFNSSDL